MDIAEFHDLSRSKKNSFNTVLAADTTIPPQLRSMQARARMLGRGIGQASAKSIIIALALALAEHERELAIEKEADS